METLEEILQKTRKWDEDAFEQLCERLLPLIRGIYYNHYFYELELEDFIQEADWLLVKVLQKTPSIPAKKFIPYFRKTLINFSIQEIRHEHRKRVIPHQLLISDSLCESVCEYAYAYPFDEMLALKEDTNSYLGELSTLERTVLLEVMEGYSFQHVAQEHRKEVSSVHRAYQRSRQKYKNYFCKKAEKSSFD